MPRGAWRPGSRVRELYCNRTALVCEPRAFAAAGQPCNDLSDGSFALCSGGARCVRPKDAAGARPPQGTCTTGATENAPCYRDAADGPACAVTLRCVYDTIGAPTGRCMQQVPAACGKVSHDAGVGG